MPMRYTEIMRGMRRKVVALLALAAISAPALVSAIDWAVVLRVTAPSTTSDHGIHETRLLIGTAPDATDGFEPAEDAAAPYDAPPPTLPNQTGLPPVGLLRAWFDHPEYLGAAQPTALWRDLRAPGGWPKTWTLYVQPSAAATVPNVTIWWTMIRPVCNRLQFLLRPITSGATAMAQVDMAALASVQFSAATTATRFNLVVQPDPTRLPAAPPAKPLGLWSPRQGAGRVLLTWLKNLEPDLVGYHIYRSTISGSGYARLTEIPAPRTKTTFFDTTASNGQTSYYRLTAVNSDGCASDFSDELAVTLP